MARLTEELFYGSVIRGIILWLGDPFVYHKERDRIKRANFDATEVLFYGPVNRGIILWSGDPRNFSMAR